MILDTAEVTLLLIGSHLGMYNRQLPDNLPVRRIRLQGILIICNKKIATET